MNTNKQKNSPTYAERFVFHSHLLLVDAVFLEASYLQLSIRERTISCFEFWIRNGWFHIRAVQIKVHRTRLPFQSPVCCGPHPTSHVVVSFIPCLFFYSRHFVPCTESFAFRNRRPSGADHLSGWDFNRRECLQFDHSQRFESTTDRFALQLYGKFNWKYGQIGLLCSLWIYDHWSLWPTGMNLCHIQEGRKVQTPAYLENDRSS